MKNSIKYIYLLFFCFFYLGARTQTYDRVKAIAYAEKWWNGFNTNKNPPEDGGPYINYTEHGGDCAAFVSQCLKAGGLDLSKGTDGKGAGVGTDGVIPGVLRLIEHLKKYQVAYYEAVIGDEDRAEPDFVKPGDPVFLREGEIKHSIFCVAVESGRNVYNAHTNHAYHRPKPAWGYPDAHCFHIGPPESNYPTHCDNCKQDADETAIDCGGSCPPCADAPQNQNISGGNLTTSDVYALNDISVNNVTIQSGSKINMVAGNNIVLGPGFLVEKGGGLIMNASKDRSKITRSFRKTCVRVYTAVTPNDDGINDTFTTEVSGMVYIQVSLYTLAAGGIDKKPIHIYEQAVNEDGIISLWNARINGNLVPSYSQYHYVVTARSYTGDEETTTGILGIVY